MAKTKIIVLKLKKLTRFIIPAVVVVVLFLLMLLFFSKTKKNDPADTAPQTPTPTPAAVSYRAGIYNSTITLNDSNMNLEVVVDTDRVKAVHLTYLDETAAAMYPLFESSAEAIGEQLVTGTALSELTLSDSSRYTQTLLIAEIQKILQKASVSNELTDTNNE